MNGIISNLKSLNKYFRIIFFHLKKIIFYGVINFNKFWNNFDKKSLPIEMITIIDKFLLSDFKNFVSGWWKYNNIKDIKALSVKGIENYGEFFSIIILGMIGRIRKLKAY